jgi:hypothetical protein
MLRLELAQAAYCESPADLASISTLTQLQHLVVQDTGPMRMILQVCTGWQLPGCLAKFWLQKVPAAGCGRMWHMWQDWLMWHVAGHVAHHQTTCLHG